MNNLKKIMFISLSLLMITGCKKEEVKPVEKQVIEVEEKPIEDKTTIGANTFASKAVMSSMNNEDQNYTNSIIDYNKIKQGNFDIAVIPAYLAPILYNESNEGFKIAAITLTDNLYLVSDTKINNEMDYRGKNLYIPDLYGNLSKIISKKIGALNLIMNFNIEYFNNMNLILDKMNQSENYVSLIPEPFFTKALKDRELYVSDLSDLLSIGNDEFLSEVLIVNNDYLNKNKISFDKFLDEYKKVTNGIKENKNISDDILNEYEITKEEADSAIDKMNFTFIDGDTMRGTYSVFMDLLEDFDKNILGERRPSEDIYYIK